ncbi:MAG: helix-turn-helix domain-containing protein [bacterium]
MDWARIDKKGYYYLIHVRGQRNNPLFFNYDDMGAFINMLKQVIDETDMKLIAYSLLRTEYYLLVYRNNTTLAQFMLKLETKYSMYFNEKYETVGYVHQGRYENYIILNESNDMPRVINSIHYLPEESGITEDYKTYPFSSIGFYSGRKAYIESMQKYDFDNDITDRDYETYRNCIGSKEEYVRLLKRQPGREMGKFNERRRDELAKSLKILMKERNLPADIFSLNRHRTGREKKLIREIISEMNKNGYSQSEISRYLGMHRSTINKIIKRK